jgi:hypothetical protein
VFNKDFREAERAADRAEGARQAITDAQTTFNHVYAGAQRQMASVRTIGEGEIKKLYSLMDDKNRANADDLSSFFANARDALRTHQDVLDFTPEANSTEGAKPQP